MAAREELIYPEEKIKNSGRIPRFFHNLHKSIKEKEDSENSKLFKIIDFAYSYYVGGSLLEKDQKIFADMNGKKAHNLTKYNALVFGTAAALLQAGAGKGIYAASDISAAIDKPLDMIGDSFIFLAAGVTAYNLFRAVDSSINKRCWPAIGDVFIFINGYTVLEEKFKKFKEKHNIENKTLYEPYRYMGFI